MPQNVHLPSEPTQNDKSTDQADNSILAAPVAWIERNPLEAVAIFKSYGAPFAGVALAGPISSLLPLGPLTPFAAILATSFASFKLRQDVLGGLCELLHAGGLSGFQGQLLSLLSFMSLSATFDSLNAPLQSWVNELLLSVGEVQTTLAGLSFSIVADMIGLFGALPRYVRGKSASAAMAALQSFFASKGLTWGQDMLHRLWQSLNNLFRESVQAALPNQTSDDDERKSQTHATWRAQLQNIGGVIQDLMIRSGAEHAIYKQNLDDWEMLEPEIENPDPFLDETQRRTVELIGEISQLIDGCEGLPYAEWDELVAMLEAEQSAFRERDYDENRTHEGPYSSIFFRQVGHDALGDWEHVT